MPKSDEKILKQWEREFKKGLVSYLILLLLLEKEMYGYELTHTLNGLSKGQITYQESGVYQILKKLNKKKIVTWFHQSSPRGPARKYYRLTDRGRELLKRFTNEQVLSFKAQMERLIDEDSTGVKFASSSARAGESGRQRKRPPEQN